jgi:hypothetical protein
MKKLLFAALGLACLFALPIHAQTSTHDVTLTITLAGSCNAATPCYTEIYRSQVASPSTACPSALTSYTLIASSLLGSSVTNTGTTTIYDDQDPSLVSGNSYCYVATDAYLSFPPPGGESGISPSTLVTFPLPPAPPLSIVAKIKK